MTTDSIDAGSAVRLPGDSPSGRGAMHGIARVAAVGAGAAAALTLGIGFTAGAALVMAPALLSRGKRPRRRRMLPVVPGRHVLLPQPAAEAAPSGSEPSFRAVALVAALKTITYKIGAASLAFSLSYAFVGDVTTAATLSAIWFVGGPGLYFVHEVIWTRVSPRISGYSSGGRPLVDIRFPFPGGARTLPIRRDIAKSVTWRTVATVTDFAVIFLVTGNLVIAAELTAAGVLVGTTVYFLHEMAWDFFGRSSDKAGPLALAAA